MVMYVTLDKGTMFGGKSSQLHKLYRFYMRKRKYNTQGNISTDKLRILIIKHGMDNRYSGEDHIITHDGKKIPCIRLLTLMDIIPSDWDVIIIDEAQWFSDLYMFISTYFYTSDTIVNIAGLNGDKNQMNFGDINRISPFCSEEHIHYGMCAVCGNNGPFTKYRGDSSERDIVGGDDDYYTVCHEHLNVPASEIDSYIDHPSN